jgi:tRNA threonylcarbamoyladenosine biosynthesis protein TsaB
MRVLALDSTTRAGSVALLIDSAAEHTLDERAGDSARTHAERLPSDLTSLLASHRLTVADIDLFVVASGPGLFTGLRVGIATMQGLALVAARPLLAVSALDALGQLASREQAAGTSVGAWIDAHRRDVFAALFRVESAPIFDSARLSIREGPSVGDPASTGRRWLGLAGAPAIIAGDGAVLYQAAIGSSAIRVENPSPLAGAMAAMALARYRRGERGSPAGVQPLYIRRPDAELAKEHALAHRAAHVDRAD